MTAGTPVPTLDELAAHMRAMCPQLMQADITLDTLTLLCAPQDIVSVLKFLRDDPQCRFNQLSDICGVDYPTRAKRFELVYHLLSMDWARRVRVKCELDEKTIVPSAVQLFPAANWYEREAFDLYGILFANHPDLRRLLTDYNFVGHPLRKDFPLTGWVEVRYDAQLGRVVNEPVSLTQDFRDFDFASPWDGVEQLFARPAQAPAKGEQNE